MRLLRGNVLHLQKDFHAKALDQSDEDTLSMYLEPGERE